MYKRVTKSKYNFKDKATSFITEVSNIHDFKYDYSLMEYKGAKIKIKIKCPNHDIFEQTPDLHRRGSGCPKCGQLKKQKYEQQVLDNAAMLFIKQANIIHDTLYSYNEMTYTGTHKKIEIICPKHTSFWQTPSSHLFGRGCPKCGQENRKLFSLTLVLTTQEFIQKANQIHNNRYQYIKSVYIRSNKNIIITCPDHGDFQLTPCAHISAKRGCQTCTQQSVLSKPELIIANWLTTRKINFEIQKTFPNLISITNNGRLRYDFYIPSNNTLLEYDGEHHFKPISFTSYDDPYANLATIQKRDHKKNEYAKENGYTLIRIPYNKFKTLENELELIFCNLP